MGSYILFFLVILTANIIQGITGFAGTILAMPFSLMLVGYNVAKPVLNVLTILSGSYVFLGNREHVNWKELRKIVIIMAVGIFCGILIRGALEGREQILYVALGVFVIALSIQGLFKMWRAQRRESEQEGKQETGSGTSTAVTTASSPLSVLMLPLAGIVHGIFVSGGPLLIGYLTGKIPDKVSFRATISTVWIFLNTLVLVDDLRAGLWDLQLLQTFLLSVPFLLAGMFIGSKLYARMSQQLFMLITYVLLFISGLSLLLK